LGGSRRGASRLRSNCGSVVLCGLIGINYFEPLILLVAAAWIPSLHLTLATHVLIEMILCANIDWSAEMSR
jgi:hypothetical protein